MGANKKVGNNKNDVGEKMYVYRFSSPGYFDPKQMNCD